MSEVAAHKWIIVAFLAAFVLAGWIDTSAKQAIEAAPPPDPVIDRMAVHPLEPWIADPFVALYRVRQTGECFFVVKSGEAVAVHPARCSWKGEK